MEGTVLRLTLLREVVQYMLLTAMCISVEIKLSHTIMQILVALLH